jgi:hypothetical protein
LLERARQSLGKQPNIIFASGGEGLGMGAIGVSVHKDYTSYSDFISSMRREWADIVIDLQSFLVSLRGEVQAKPFSLKPLADILPTVIKRKL